MKPFTLILCAFFMNQLALAQTSESAEPPPLISDRPSQSDAAKVVLPGTFQLEAGFSFQRVKGYYRQETEFHYPETALRVGILKGIEARLKGNLKHYRVAYNKDRYPGRPDRNSETGLGDVLFGFKFQLTKPRDRGLTMALQTETTLPLESYPYRTRVLQPILKLCTENEIGNRFSIQTNVGLQFQDPGGDNLVYQVCPLYSFVLGYDLSERFNVFSEVHGHKEAGELFQHGFDAGISYLATPNLQLDAFSGFGLTENAPDLFVNAGFSYRFRQ